MKKISNFLAFLFVIVGLGLSITIIISICSEGKIQFGLLDWDYSKKVNDISGILGFLFTGAGTFAIFLTLIKQQEQFDQAQKQVISQQFETTFFNMLNQLFSIKNSINYRIEDNTLIGQEFMHYVLEDLKLRYATNVECKADIKEALNDIANCIEIQESKIQMIKDDLNDVYLVTYNLYYSHLGHYFRYFYNLIKFTIESRKKSGFNDSEKYIQLIQAQLSNDELGLIFCNSISEKALNKQDINLIYGWIEEYKILENTDSQSLLNRSLHPLYPKTIFKFLNNSEKKIRSL